MKCITRIIVIAFWFPLTVLAQDETAKDYFTYLSVGYNTGVGKFTSVVGGVERKEENNYRYLKLNNTHGFTFSKLSMGLGAGLEFWESQLLVPLYLELGTPKKMDESGFNLLTRVGYAFGSIDYFSYGTEMSPLESRMYFDFGLGYSKKLQNSRSIGIDCSYSGKFFQGVSTRYKNPGLPEMEETFYTFLNFIGLDFTYHF